MYHFIDYYSLLSVSPESSVKELFAAFEKYSLDTKNTHDFIEARRILLDPFLRVSYDQEYYRVKGKKAANIQNIVTGEDEMISLKSGITETKKEHIDHPQPTYFYIVTESLVERFKETTVNTRVFDKPSTIIEVLRNEAYRYFNERKKILEFWRQSNIYPRKEEQEVELDIKLIKQTAAGSKEYLIRSLRKITPQDVQDYESRILNEDRKLAPSFFNCLSALNSPQQSGHMPENELQPTRQTHYEILDLARNASQHEIENAYKRKQNTNNISMWHPDWLEGKGTYNRSRQIHEAYKVLSNPSMRVEYDALLSYASQKTNQPPY